MAAMKCAGRNPTTQFKMRRRGARPHTQGLALSLCLLGPPRVETFTSENNELWKKVETLENANRWVVPPACPLTPALLQPVAGSGIALGGRREERPLSSE